MAVGLFERVGSRSCSRLVVCWADQEERHLLEPAEWVCEGEGVGGKCLLRHSLPQ